METKLRFIGTNMIESAGILLKLYVYYHDSYQNRPQIAMATACVLFHRFYYTCSLKEHDIQKISMGALFLSCKIEECSRKIRDIVNVFDYLHSKNEQDDYQVMDYSGQKYFTLKEEMIHGERLILANLGFNVRVQHPYGYLINYLQALELHENIEFSQTAWNYLNDSLRTVICVCYQPSDIACAVIYLAAQKFQLALPSSPAWWQVFEACEGDLIDIGKRIEYLYSIQIKK